MASRQAAIALAVAATVLAIIFGWRAYQAWGALRQPLVPSATTRDTSIQPWMSVRYIARVYGVPRTELAQALGLPADASTNLTLLELAHRRGVPPGQTVDLARQAVDTLRAASPAPTPPGPAPPRPQ